MRRRHSMPFGAEHRDGATRFRLWAPACPAVRLELGRSKPRSVAMAREADGWHGVTVNDAPPGEAYGFRVDEGRSAVPDPASRFNPWDVNGPSAVVDPHGYEWHDADWRGRPWSEAVVYEMHVGTFTPEGTFAAAAAKLEYLARLGVTAIELMPLADFAGRRNWGYDGVLHFAPDSAYGSPDDLKRFVDAAHARGLMVLLDVVYNHFGPEGNHLPAYAPQFFNAAHQTPWGAAVNFDGEHSRTVRDFFVHNALYWIEEFHFDGLRLDAIHAIADESPTHIVAEIAAAIAAGPGRERHVHQVLENDRNEARFLTRRGPGATAQWNDDAHHAYHVLACGETGGYYTDYADHPAAHLGRALAEGFAYQGEASAHREGQPRGEKSSHLPPEAFIAFLQNHDQAGNRAFGERLGHIAAPGAMRLASATLLLAPQVPMLFMGEEFDASSPFLYFCDFTGELARAVREGRRKEFAAFFSDADDRERIPDPGAEETFLASKLRWDEMGREPHAACLAHYSGLLALRAAHIAPRLRDAPVQAAFEAHGRTGLAVDWSFADGARLHLRANFGAGDVELPPAPGEVIHVQGEWRDGGRLGPYSGTWTLEAAERGSAEQGAA